MFARWIAWAVATWPATTGRSAMSTRRPFSWPTAITRFAHALPSAQCGPSFKHNPDRGHFPTGGACPNLLETKVLNHTDFSNAASAAKQPAKAAKSYLVEVHCAEEVGTVPFRARFDIDELLAREIVRLSSVADANDVYKLERPDYRAEFLWRDPTRLFGGAEGVGDLAARRTDRDMLVVTVDEFHFSAFCKNTEVAVETAAQSITELAEYFGLPYSYRPLAAGSSGCLDAASHVLDKALALRAQAVGLLQEAQALDGLKPFTVTHSHRFGDTTYLVWSAQEPTEQQAVAVLESEFEPERDEHLAIEGNHTLEEVAGLATNARLPVSCTAAMSA